MQVCREVEKAQSEDEDDYWRPCEVMEGEGGRGKGFHQRESQPAQKPVLLNVLVFKIEHMTSNVNPTFALNAWVWELKHWLNFLIYIIKVTDT